MPRGFEITDDGVVLDLDESCIETAARHARRELVDALLGNGATRDVKTAFALLDDLLRLSDFGAMRAGDPELAGHHGCRVLLSRDDDGLPEVTKIDGRKGKGG